MLFYITKGVIVCEIVYKLTYWLGMCNNGNVIVLTIGWDAIELISCVNLQV